MKKLLLISVFIFMSAMVFASENKSVVIISIDSLHPKSIDLAKPKNIMSLMEKGIFSLKGVSVNPPKTLVSHTAMAVGKKPEESGYTSNVWKKGQPTVKLDTIFHDAKKLGYKTFYVYSKSKLGFLNNPAIDQAVFAGEEAVYKGIDIVNNTSGDYFLFLHISGLDFIGPKRGWLSPEYLEEFSFIDEDIAPMIEQLMRKKNTTIIITSDHSGHDKIHGSQHLEDFKIPFIVYSDMADFSRYQNQPYISYQLRMMLKNIFR